MGTVCCYERYLPVIKINGHKLFNVLVNNTPMSYELCNIVIEYTSTKCRICDDVGYKLLELFGKKKTILFQFYDIFLFNGYTKYTLHDEYIKYEYFCKLEQEAGFKTGGKFVKNIPFDVFIKLIAHNYSINKYFKTNRVPNHQNNTRQLRHVYNPIGMSYEKLRELINGYN